MKTEALALADYLDNNVEAMLFTEQPHLDRASAMIRRLVEELDRNKIYIQKMEDALGCDVSYYEPLNKPVNPFAWVDEIGVFVTNEDYKELHEKLKEGMTPLYTSPHSDSDVKQTKPLSDEEIYQTWVEAKNTALNTRGSDFVEVIFARAIEERHGIK